MTNKEKYQRVFSTLHASDRMMEVTTMKHTKKFRMSRLAAVCAAVILVLGLATVAYAADIGGIQRQIQIWIHGDQTDAVLEVQGGEYTLTYEGEDGQTHRQQGGGMAIDLFGNERPLTEEELLDHLDEPEVEYRDDGSVWVYYHEQKLEITDLFDEDGVCYVQLEDGTDTIYMTVKYQNGYSYSNKYYPEPR